MDFFDYTFHHCFTEYISQEVLKDYKDYIEDVSNNCSDCGSDMVWGIWMDFLHDCV